MTNKHTSRALGFAQLDRLSLIELNDPKRFEQVERTVSLLAATTQAHQLSDDALSQLIGLSYLLTDGRMSKTAMSYLTTCQMSLHLRQIIGPPSNFRRSRRRLVATTREGVPGLTGGPIPVRAN
jgi:hypothetical protein